MIAIETNTRSPRKTNSRPALEIRFHFVDGSKKTFITANSEAAEAIRDRINLANVFHQTRIVVADDYSKSVFVCSQINRVDFLFNGSGFSIIPPDHADLVELTKAEFDQCVPMSDPTLLQKRDHRRHGRVVRPTPELVGHPLDEAVRGPLDLHIGVGGRSIHRSWPGCVARAQSPHPRDEPRALDIAEGVELRERTVYLGERQPHALR